jgi:iron(III) transport system permease protein
MATVSSPGVTGGAPGGRSRWRFRWRPGPVLCSAVLVVMLLIVLYPMLLLLYSTFLVEQPGGGTEFGLDYWINSWGEAGMGLSIWNTFKRVVFTEIFAIPAAVLLAWLVTRTDLPGKKLVDAFCWIAFFLPALPVLMGWILLFDPEYGLANQAVMAVTGAAEGPFDIYTFAGMVFAHLAARSVAAKYIFLAPAFRNLDSSMEEAGRISGSGPIMTLRRISLPILMPAFLIMLCISLLHSLESFEIELILGPPTGFYVFSTKIYQVINEDPPLFGVATVLAMAVLISLLPLIFYQQHLSSSRSFVTVTSHFSSNLLRLRKLRVPVFVLVCAFGLLITAVPVIFLLMGTFMNLFGYFNVPEPWTLEHWASVLSDPPLIKATTNTLIMGGAAALIGVVWYSLVAYISARTRYPGRGIIDFLSWLPASLPGIILGLALLWTFLNIPLFRPLYGTIAVLVIALMLNSISTGVQLLKGNMVQLGAELEEASYVTGGSWAYTFRRVVLPLMAPALVSVGLLTFASAVRQVSAIAMLVTGDTRPLSMLQVDNMVDGSFEAAAVIGTLIVIITLAVAGAARFITARLGFSALGTNTKS